jgi:hypothetical protein
LKQMGGATDHIRNSKSCLTRREKLQHWAFYLHKSYIISELCRPAISPTAPKTELAIRMRHTCIENLANTVQAWLGLSRLTPFASRSWAAMHRSLSSALLLGIMSEQMRRPEIMVLLAELLQTLDVLTADIDPSEISGPIQRSILWLKKLTSSVTTTPASSTEWWDIGSDDSPYAVVDRMMWTEGWEK